MPAFAYTSSQIPVAKSRLGVPGVVLADDADIQMPHMLMAMSELTPDPSLHLTGQVEYHKRFELTVFRCSCTQFPSPPPPLVIVKKVPQKQQVVPASSAAASSAASSGR
jgi:hypothetical protein